CARAPYSNYGDAYW
nr:immunoglobulin heavy chain junction region [Mus musculus]